MLLSRILVLATFALVTLISPAQARSVNFNDQPIPIIEGSEIFAIPEYSLEIVNGVHHHTHLVLSLSDRRVYVYQRDRLLASYPVAIGKPGWETPTGTFQVMQMLRDPIWESPFTGQIYQSDLSRNPLGPRWIGFATKGNDYIGFHGTLDPDSIGEAASYGCARMRNEDVIALFEQVDLCTTVTVVP